MKFNIFDYDKQAEPLALGMAIQAANRYVGDPDLYTAEIIVNPRKATGWLEYNIAIFKTNPERHAITIGMVQRTPDAEFEFHS